MSKSLGTLTHLQLSTSLGWMWYDIILLELGEASVTTLVGIVLLFIYFLPYFVVLDWSQEQLDKHSKEIQSLLGNFFLRITSRKIQSRIDGVPSRMLEKIHKAEPEGSLNPAFRCTRRSSG
jgi:hypothetical protein